MTVMDDSSIGRQKGKFQAQAIGVNQIGWCVCPGLTAARSWILDWEKNMKIIITGGAGFIGCNAASRYLRQGHDVIIVDNLSRQGVSQNIEWLQPQGALEFVRVDIRNESDLAAVFRKHRDADRILHLAA